MIWRLVADQRLNSTLLEISTRWSLEDVFEAHAALDALDAMMAAGSE